MLKLVQGNCDGELSSRTSIRNFHCSTLGWTFLGFCTSSNFADEFHTYGLIWNKSYIATYIDSEDNTVVSVNTTEMSFLERGGFNGWANPWRGRNNSTPFDRLFYLLIDLAVGGTGGYFPDLGTNYTKPWLNTSLRPAYYFYSQRQQWESTWTLDFEIDSVKVWTYSDALWENCMTPNTATPKSGPQSQPLPSTLFRGKESGGNGPIVAL